MVSSRTLEIVSRFSKWSTVEETLENIDEYVNECNELYYDAKGRGASKSYLSTMADRLFSVAEARDYVQKNGTLTDGNAERDYDNENMMFHLTRTAKVLRSKGFNDLEVAYIRRFQGKAINGTEHGTPSIAAEAAEEHQRGLVEMWDRRKEQGVGEGYEFFGDRIAALSVVIKYFNNMQVEIDNL